jgi:hypothetical protein
MQSGCACCCSRAAHMPALPACIGTHWRCTAAAAALPPGRSWTEGSPVVRTLGLKGGKLGLSPQPAGSVLPPAQAPSLQRMQRRPLSMKLHVVRCCHAAPSTCAAAAEAIAPGGGSELLQKLLCLGGLVTVTASLSGVPTWHLLHLNMPHKPAGRICSACEQAVDVQGRSLLRASRAADQLASPALPCPPKPCRRWPSQAAALSHVGPLHGPRRA